MECRFSIFAYDDSFYEDKGEDMTGSEEEKVQVVSEHRAVVFTMVKHPFLVGFLVAELLRMEIDMSGSEGHDLIRRQCLEEAYALPLLSDKNSSLEIESFDNERMRMYELTSEKRSNAINKCQSLAMAYVIDQADVVPDNDVEHYA